HRCSEGLLFKGGDILHHPPARDDVVLEGLMIVRVRAAGYDQRKTLVPAIGVGHVQRQKPVADGHILEEIREVYLVLAPETGVLALKAPGAQIEDERGYLRIRIFYDSSFFDRRESEFFFDPVLAELVAENGFVVQLRFDHLSVLQRIGRSL